MNEPIDKRVAIDPSAIATNAAAIMRLAQESTALSLLELAIVFKAAAQICDEMRQCL